MIIFIDYRERELITAVNNLPRIMANVRVASLKAGDIIFAYERLRDTNQTNTDQASSSGQSVDQEETFFEQHVRIDGKPARPPSSTMEYSPILVFERKTVSDLSKSVTARSSIPDLVRWKDQKIRMQTFCNATASRPGLIAESYKIDMLARSALHPGGLDDQGYQSSVLRTAVRDGFITLFTASVEDTARTLDTVAQWVMRDNIGNGGWTRHGDIPTESAISVRKRDNVTAPTFFRRSLQLIPGISESIAQAINRTYPTMNSLLVKYHDQEMTDTAKRKLLENVELETLTPTGKKRRVGPAKSKMVYSCLVGNELVENE